MSDPSWSRSFNHPHVELSCECGWTGHDADIEDWAIETDRDRVVRRCPGCGDRVPEWGVLPSIEGAAKIARGSLQRCLAESEKVAVVDQPR